jgi:predicted DNA-binding transcriptional regulator AlpA
MDVQFISPGRAAELTSFSTRHLSRLVEQGTFPKPLRLGTGINGRLAFVEHEVRDWIRARLAKRDAKAA